jgi:hypothetical protein
MKPATASVLALLKQQGRLGVTPALALERVGTFRLAARISELRADGHVIETTIIRTPTGKHPARYVLQDPSTL